MAARQSRAELTKSLEDELKCPIWWAPPRPPRRAPGTSRARPASRDTLVAPTRTKCNHYFCRHAAGRGRARAGLADPPRRAAAPA